MPQRSVAGCRSPCWFLRISKRFRTAHPKGSVRQTAWRNSQQRIDALVSALLAGDLTDDVERYAAAGVSDPHYSHLLHFAWIYSRQIASIRTLMDRYSATTIVVADLGTGCGHFLVTLARYLAAEGMTSRARLIGIDAASDDLAHARLALAQLPQISAELVTDDLRSESFADRLRQLRPDVVIANHVLEHLEGDIKNRYLQDWALAAK